jgi:CheY-like chemotaxis protein
MKLLIIDDQEEVGEIISEIASQMGWDIATSHTADDVVEAIIRDGVDAIFIDYFMPGKNGLEIVAELRDRNFRKPVILFSGMVSEIDQETAERLGVFQVLEKPLTLAVIRKALNDLAQALKSGA